MSITPQERAVLEDLARELREADPRLASLLSHQGPFRHRGSFTASFVAGIVAVTVVLFGIVVQSGPVLAAGYLIVISAIVLVTVAYSKTG